VVTTEAPIIAVVGPTASGKTAWGMGLAEAFGGEIVGADSRQIYRKLEIGTAKPTAEARARVRHHCIDQIEPSERYHLGQFRRDATAALTEIRARDRRPIVVGGTGQYVWALLEGWDVPEVAPDAAFRRAMEERAATEGAATLHAELAAIDAAAAAAILPNNVRRVIRALEVHRATGRPISTWHATRDPLAAVIVGPRVAREVLDERIDDRVRAMFAAGLVAETEALLAAGLAPDAPGLESIGYREVVRHLSGECSLEAAMEGTQQSTRRLARRQGAWFRADDERIRWCDTLEEARSVVEAGLSAA
jgi:tRNA dimethylallyltransferase